MVDMPKNHAKPNKIRLCCKFICVTFNSPTVSALSRY